MLKKSKIYLLMLIFVLMVSIMPLAFAAENVNKLVYEVKYSSEDLSTPSDWYNSSYFNHPDYKEDRFVQYWVETPITPGGPRDTGFYMLYNDTGLHMFFQSNELERETNGILKSSSIEMFLKTGQGTLPYHQMIIHTNDSPIEFYEWQTENRSNRPFKGNAIIINQEIPTGWGTVVTIPWEVYYDYLPIDGENWEFSMIRWSPSHAPTWGGRVHQVGRFNTLEFQAPTAEQRSAIQKNVILKGWQKFNETIAQLNATWLNGDLDDETFFNHNIQPLINDGLAKGNQIPNIDNLNAAEIDGLYHHVEGWFEFNYEVEDERISYIKDWLFGEKEEEAGVIMLTLDKTVLTPPNNKMVPIHATITHSHGIGGIASFELTSITSNEDDNGLGEGNSTNDIQDAEFGTADTSFSLRAKRLGQGDGRVYTVTYTVTDHKGVTSTVSATVTVPKSKEYNE